MHILCGSGGVTPFCKGRTLSSERLSNLLKVLKMQSGEVRNEMQIWADWRGHTLPGYTGQWVVGAPRIGSRQPPAEVEGLRWNGLEFLGLGFAPLPIGKGQN